MTNPASCCRAWNCRSERRFWSCPAARRIRKCRIGGDRPDALAGNADDFFGAGVPAPTCSWTRGSIMESARAAAGRRECEAISLPLPLSYAPMEARSVEQLPEGKGWQYEPKWDGFRCLAFRDGDMVDLRSKSAQPLARYFPDL